MNKQTHRLVFDRRRGMRVPAAEHVRAAGKAGAGQSRAVRAACAAVAAAGPALAAVLGGAPPALTVGGLVAVAAWSPMHVQAQARRSLGQALPRASRVISQRSQAGRPVRNLPVRASSEALRSLDRGAFTVHDPAGTVLQIDQADQRVIINWDSFDIGRGYTVRFNQPQNGSALNNIWTHDPSVILGNLQANGEVILQNQNGVIFGPTARVQTQRFVATALKLAKETFEAGIRNDVQGKVIFGGEEEQSNQGFISIERGAEIKALAGGDVLMVAPRVYNEGRIETPGGQTVLAAGQKVYLTSSTDAAQRGLIVAVDAFAQDESSPEGLNTVEQAQAGTYKTVNGETVADDTPDNTAGLVKKINEVVAEKGSINLVGMTVRQNGVLSATTAVKGQNGAIYLHAMKDTKPIPSNGGEYRAAAQLGSVELGENSVTAVTPSSDGATQKDAEAFYRSRIDVMGRDIRVRQGAAVQAVSGNIALRAAESTDAGFFPYAGNNTAPDSSRLVVEDGALITAAGLRDVLLPMSRNQLDLRLFQNELADAPVQRGGVLYRSRVFADARKQVAVANVKGAYNLVERNARELSTRGGTISLQSLGATVIAEGARLDISGGSKRYEAGQVFSSTLVRGNGSLVALEDADAAARYTRLINPVDTANPQASLDSVAQQAEREYVEGADAGTLKVTGTAVHLGGEVKADVVVGPRQRNGRVNSAAYVASSNRGEVLADGAAELGIQQLLVDNPHLYASLRPRAGQVVIGARQDAGYYMAEVRLSAAGAPALGAVPEFGDADSQGWWGNLATGAHVSAQKLQAGGVGRLALIAGQVRIDGDVRLDLGASGELAVDSDAGARLDGRIKAEGGAVTMTSRVGDVVLGARAHVDLRGRTSDERRTATDMSDGVAVDGGAFTASAGRSVVLEAGAQVDVSAGQWTSRAGEVRRGRAGAIVLAANTAGGSTNPDQEFTGRVQIGGAHLQGYGFSDGGRLAISGMRTLWIGQDAAAAGAAWDQGLALAPEFFSAGGFGTFDLTALGNVAVAPGTLVRPVLSNLVAMPTTVRSGTRLPEGLQSSEALTRVDVLPAGVRAPVSISLAAKLQPKLGADVPAEGLNLGGSLLIGEGAELDTGAGGSLTLKAGRNLTVAGTLRARGGTVSLSLLGDRGGETPVASTDQVGYLADQFLRLKDGSLIDVSGTARTTTNATGSRTTGEVLGGGSVRLNQGGARGMVVAEQGSLIDVSGASAHLHLNNSRTATRISAGAGSVHVGAADGFALQGQLKAGRPDDSVAGGQFTADLSRAAKGDAVSPVEGAQPYPEADRELLLVSSTQEAQARTPAYGQGLVSSQQLLGAGFDRITLRADDRVVLGVGASLVADPAAGHGPLRSVVIDTPVLQAQGSGDHVIQASHVSVGDRSIVPVPGQGIDRSASLGEASLRVNAGLIEVVGHSGLQGFRDVMLDATLDAAHRVGERRDGEIRLIGRTAGNGGNAKTLDGRLNFDGTLTMRSGVTYATTLSRFTVEGKAGTSRLVTQAPDQGSTSAAPWSALAQLALKAHDIEHRGVVHQPFGSIVLEAGHLATLAAGSVLSVSGEGLTVPVGTTVNGRQWLYATQGTAAGAPTATDPTVEDLDKLVVHKGVSVEGPALSIDPGSRLEAQSGGDLQAWEFVQGVGGSTDTLNRPDVFAVVPGYTYDFAPHDAEVAATAKAVGSTLQVGDRVSIGTGSGVLAAGTYTLLPARYALLPGAVLVSAAQLPSASPLARPVARDDGSVLVSGHVTSVGTAIRNGNDPRIGLLLEPESTFRAKSAITVSSINDHKAQAAQRAGDPVPALPRDGGGVSLSSATAFDWAARYNLRGAYFDLAMTDRMALVEGDEAAPQGYARVSAQALNALWGDSATGMGADSLLLGGTRRLAASDEGGTTIVKVDTRASEVLIQGNVDKVGELAAVATQTVQVEEGVTLSSSKPDVQTARRLALSGHGAALVVGNDTGLQLQRDLSGVPDGAPAGRLVVGADVRLQGGAVQMDTSGSAVIAPTVQAQARNLGLGAARIALGEGAAEDGALVLQGQLLASVNQAERVQLRAYDGIEARGSVQLGARGADGRPRLKELVLDTPALRGSGGAGDPSVLTARQVVLRNTSNKTAAPAAAGTGRLVLRAEPDVSDVRTGGITVAEGAQRLAFQSVTLETRGDVVFQGTGTLHTQSDVTLSAARVTATGAARHGVVSGGTVAITQAPGGRTLGEVRGLGAQLRLQGQRVVQGGTIELPSGAVELQGTGQEGRTDTIVFEQGSRTLAHGQVLKAGTGWAVSTAGGSIAATAQQGDIVVRGLLDVSAGALASDSDEAKTAGAIRLKATAQDAAVHLGAQAQLRGQAATDSLSGRLSVDTGRLVNEPQRDASGVAIAQATQGTLDRIATLAREGGLRNEVDLRLRQGHQSLDTMMKAVRASISVDGGSLTLMGGAKVDATAPQGGVVQFAAHDDVVMMAGSSIQADSTRAGANGGDVLLSSTQGHLRLEEGSAISAQGDDGQDGRIVLRARRDDDAADPAERVNIGPVGAELHAAEIVVEAVRTYEGYTRLATGNSNGTTLGQNTLRRESDAFMQAQDLVMAALGLSELGNAHLRAGVEIRSAGDFTVASDWNLQAWHPEGAQPIMLSILAGGHLSINGTISDGFASAQRAAATATEPTAVQPGDAASFRLVAGADHGAAHVLKTVDGAQADLTIAGAKMVRTTSGSIEMAAARDVTLQTGTGSTPVQAVAYVAGRLNVLPDGQQAFETGNAWSQFTSHGGRLEVQAGRDVSGPSMSQMIGNWLYHVGSLGPESVAWWSTFDSFKQGFGSFGGGNIRVAAGRDVRDVGVVAPTSARHVYDSAGGGQLRVDNGGDVTVRAGNDVLGGVFLLGRGEGLVQAGGRMAPGAAIGTTAPDGLGAILGLMEGHWKLEAGLGLTLSTVYSPTALASPSRRVDEFSSARYFLYAPDSSVSLSATRGDVVWNSGSLMLGALFENLHAGPFIPLQERVNTPTGDGRVINEQLAMVAPPVVRMAAMDGNVEFLLGQTRGSTRGKAYDLFLHPSAQGDLSVYASGNVTLTNQGGASVGVIMGDGDPSRWPSVTAPVADQSLLTTDASSLDVEELLPSRMAQYKTPLLSSTLHQHSTVPARIYAGQDIRFSSNASAEARPTPLVLPKPAEIEAGGDIRNLEFRGQHFDPQDVTTIKAGGSIVGNQGNGAIEIRGPGELNIEAGRQLDLQTSKGVLSLGNQAGTRGVVDTHGNAALGEEAAKIRIAAGMDKAVNLDDFSARFLADNRAVQALLIAYVKATLKLDDQSLPALPAPGSSQWAAVVDAAYPQALAQFAGLSQGNQVRFAEAVVTQAFVDRFVAPGQPFAQAWKERAAAAGVGEDAYASPAFRRFKEEVMFAEVERLGDQAVALADSTDPRENERRKVQRQQWWDEAQDVVSLAGLGKGFLFSGDIDLAGSKVHSLGKGGFAQGGIDLIAPGGQILVGLVSPTAGEGLVTYQGGSIRAYAERDFQVNSQKAFVVGQGDLTIYSARGAIDSGRGSNTDVSVPAPVPVMGPNGIEFRLPAVTTGKGIGLLRLPDGPSGGDVNLYAPVLGIRALDTYIRNEAGGDIKAGGPVAGGDNLKGSVQGVAAPVVRAGLRVGGATPTEATAGAETVLDKTQASERKDVNSILTVELTGMGGEAPGAGGDGKDGRCLKGPKDDDC